MFYKADRVVIGWLLTTVQGVNRTDARIVAKLRSAFDIENLDTVKKKEARDEYEAEVSDLELRWVLDIIDKRFDESAVPTNLAAYVLDFEERAKKMLEASKDK